MLTSTLTGKGFTEQTRFSRGLSLFLLLLIVYGTTVEAAHRHGSVKSTEQTTGTTFLSDTGTTKAPTLKLVGCGDCLICQLHLNFSTTVFAIHASNSPLSGRALIFEVETVAVHSHTLTPQTGRAPPLA